MTDKNTADSDWKTAATKQGWIIPDWPAPSNVNAVSTTRHGGVSQPPYASLNLGDHVGDDGLAVAANRQRVGDILRLPTEPLWLEQVHGTTVAGMQTDSCYPQADASVAFKPRQVSIVMTADCLPVLFCDRQGTRVASAHAGWRGLCDGVLEQTVSKLDCAAEDLLVWLGPAIGPQQFEVGDEVRAAFMAHDPRAEAAFQTGASSGKWLADIYRLARQRLNAQGVEQIFGDEFCTVSEPERFFSYRRDGQTGRMASLIWLSD
ncbi:MAG: peptidoglycan editing factor PgeF [Thiolinea sp.]